MTKKLFWTDPYQTTLETRIADVEGPCVSVDETIFFPFSGGQESDTGAIGGYPVLEASKAGKEIEYTLPEGHGLKKGDQVTIQIDWERRFSLMRLHFAAELVLEIMYRKLSGTEKIGAHIAEDKARIDFTWPESITPLLPEVAAEVEAIVQQDAAIISAFSDEENEQRYWEVAGFAKVPCGGTHLKRTGEVGKIRLKRVNIGRGKERVEIHFARES
jgi:alanyl-tRNA synthetase